MEVQVFFIEDYCYKSPIVGLIFELMSTKLVRENTTFRNSNNI